MAPPRVPLTDSPEDRLVEIANPVDPRAGAVPGPRLGIGREGVLGMAELTKGSRIRGGARDKLRAELRKKYEKGASIRALAESTGRSYGFIHQVLSEAGVTLRSRGGATRTKQK